MDRQRVHLLTTIFFNVIKACISQAFIVLLESSWASEATATRTTTARTSTTSEARTARATGTTTATTEGLHTAKEVQAIDHMEHAIAGNGVILCITTHGSRNGAADGALLVQDIIQLE